MNRFKDNNYFRISLYALGVIAAAMCMVIIVQNLSTIGGWIKKLFEILSPVIWGFCIAYVLNYPYKRLARGLDKIPKIKKLSVTFKKTVSMIVVYIVSIAVVVLFVYLVVPQIVTALSDFIKTLPSYLEAVTLKLQTFLYIYLERFGLSMDDIYDILSKFGESISSGFSAQEVIGKSINFILSFSESLKNLFLGLIISIYFLLDKERFKTSLKKVLFAIVPEKKGKRTLEILSFTDKTFGEFIISKALDSLIIGLICYVFMAIMRMDYAVLISVLIGVTNIIPFLGPFIGAIPSAFLLVLVNPWHALIFVIFIIVLQQFDGNFLGPKLIGKSTGIRSVFVLLSVIIFGGLFGIAGMFIGVPLFVVIYTLCTEAVRDRLKEKNITVE